MEDKPSIILQNQAFIKALRATGIQVPLIWKFFEWVHDKPKAPYYNDIIKTIDGGVQKMPRSLERDFIQTNGFFIMIAFRMDAIDNPPLEGDLDLIVHRMDYDMTLNVANDLYLATLAICSHATYKGQKKYDFFKNVLKHWRGILDTLRVKRILEGKNANLPMHKEMNLFLTTLEQMHSMVGESLKYVPLVKKRQYKRKKS